MVLCVVLGLIVLVTPNLAKNMCTTSDRLQRVENDKILPGSQIANLTMPGIMTCSRACSYRRRCQSFNFNTETGECQLNSGTVDLNARNLNEQTNFVFSDISHWPARLAGVCSDHTCPLNSYCDPVSSSGHVCRPTGCFGIPNIENGHMNETHAAEDECPHGSTLSYTCDPGYMPQGEVVCQDDGTWSSPVCVSVSSCSMVKQYQPDSGDGEYWLRLTNFDNYTTKIYCNNMSAPSPQEFLSLPNINYGIYPLIQDKDCDGTTEPLTGNCKGGEIWFSKIRVNIITMEVIKKDRTFANISNGEKTSFYGRAWDCYAEHPNNELRCGTKGRFHIDLRGTTWRVSEDQQWEPCAS